MDERSGSIVYSLDPAIADWYHLGYYASVLQADIFAVLSCCTRCPYETSVIYICTGSKACTDSKTCICILTFTSSIATSDLVKECKQALNNLGHIQSIVLVWVSGHSNIDGNKATDTSSKLDSRNPIPHISFISPSYPNPSIRM